jgi:hypothetical protein
LVWGVEKTQYWWDGGLHTLDIVSARVLGCWWLIELGWPMLMIGDSLAGLAIVQDAVPKILEWELVFLMISLLQALLSMLMDADGSISVGLIWMRIQLFLF